MSNYNFYERKLRTLESFYMWIEQGSSYNVAFGQCMYYNQPQNEFDKLLMAVTIATRFVRSKKSLPQEIIDMLSREILSYKSLNIGAYELKEEEIQVFEEELMEVKGYISR